MAVSSCFLSALIRLILGVLYFRQKDVFFVQVFHDLRLTLVKYLWIGRTILYAKRDDRERVIGGLR